MKLKLWWKTASPEYVIEKEDLDLSKISATFVCGELGNEYQEPGYYLVARGSSEAPLIENRKDNQNCTVRRGRNGPVIYKRMNGDIYNEGDVPYVVEEKLYRATPGNQDLWPKNGSTKIGSMISAKTYSNGEIERRGEI